MRHRRAASVPPGGCPAPRRRGAVGGGGPALAMLHTRGTFFRRPDCAPANEARAAWLPTLLAPGVALATTIIIINNFIADVGGDRAVIAVWYGSRKARRRRRRCRRCRRRRCRRRRFRRRRAVRGVIGVVSRTGPRSSRRCRSKGARTSAASTPIGPPVRPALMSRAAHVLLRLDPHTMGCWSWLFIWLVIHG